MGYFYDYEQVNGTVVNAIMDQLSLYKRALTKAVALPKGRLPHDDNYYSTIVNNNVVVKKEKLDTKYKTFICNNCGYKESINWKPKSKKNKICPECEAVMVRY